MDVFYNPDDDYVTPLALPQRLGFEMEAAALFTLAARAAASGSDVRAGCILTVSDTLSEEEKSEDSYLPLEVLQAATEHIIEVALEAGTSLAP